MRAAHNLLRNKTYSKSIPDTCNVMKYHVCSITSNGKPVRWKSIRSGNAGKNVGSADPVQGVSCLAATRTILAFVCVLSACYSPLCPSLAPLWYICSVKCRLQPYSTENQHEQCLFLPNIKSLIMFRYGSGCRFSLLKLERVLL